MRSCLSLPLSSALLPLSLRIAVAAVRGCSKRDASSDQAAVRDRITSVERALSTLTRRVESQVAHVADTVNDQRDWVKQVR